MLGGLLTVCRTVLELTTVNWGSNPWRSTKRYPQVGTLTMRTSHRGLVRPLKENGVKGTSTAGNNSGKFEIS